MFTKYSADKEGGPDVANRVELKFRDVENNGVNVDADDKSKRGREKESLKVQLSRLMSIRMLFGFWSSSRFPMAQSFCYSVPSCLCHSV
jgi:hypothetical protein